MDRPKLYPCSVCISVCNCQSVNCQVIAYKATVNLTHKSGVHLRSCGGPFARSLPVATLAPGSRPPCTRPDFSIDFTIIALDRREGLGPRGRPPPTAATPGRSAGTGLASARLLEKGRGGWGGGGETGGGEQKSSAIYETYMT